VVDLRLDPAAHAGLEDIDARWPIRHLPRASDRCRCAAQAYREATVAAGDGVEPEIERLAGEVLEGRVPTADAPPKPSQPPDPGSMAAAYERAWFVHRMAAGEGVLPPDADSLVGPPPTSPAGPQPGSAPARVVGPEGPDGGLAETVVAAVDGALLQERPDATLKGGGVARRTVAAFGILALLVFLGALLALQGGGGGTPPASSALAAATVVPGGGAAVATSGLTASPEPSPSADAPTESPDATPSPEPSPSEAAASPVPSPSADPSRTVLRGLVNVTPFTRTGLKVSDHAIELTVDEDTGRVTGSFVITVEEFPIGPLLTQVFGGANDPDFAKFKTCTVRMALNAKITGTWTASSGKLKGAAVITPKPADVHDCLKTRPSNVTINSVTKSTRVSWSGTFRGSSASGKISLDPALSWRATTD
jgi:hypothetical protein